LAQAQALPQEQFAAQPHAAAAGWRQPQVQVSSWQAAQRQEWGCFDSFMVSFLWQLGDGMSSMTITIVDRSSCRQPFETNRRLRSCRWSWHRANGVLRAGAPAAVNGAQMTRLRQPSCAAGVPRQPLGR